MATVLLTDNQIEEIVQQFKEQQLSLTRLEIRYIKGELYIDGFGVEGIPQTEDYYETLEEHLIYTELTWLTPLCNKLDVNFDAIVNVLPDGSFTHDSIQVELHRVVTERGLANLSPLLHELVPFKSWLTRVEFLWHDYKLRNVKFSLTLDGPKVNTILSNKGINTQIYSQWVSTCKLVLALNKGRFKHKIKLPIINGRMNTATFETGVCFKFNGRNK